VYLHIRNGGFIRSALEHLYCNYARAYCYNSHPRGFNYSLISITPSAINSISPAIISTWKQWIRHSTSTAFHCRKFAENSIGRIGWATHRTGPFFISITPPTVKPIPLAIISGIPWATPRSISYSQSLNRHQWRTEPCDRLFPSGQFHHAIAFSLPVNSMVRSQVPFRSI